MSNNPAAETLMGQYYTMPDGQVMQKMSDGRWVSVVERVKQAENSITERFKDTETTPNDWNPQTVANGIDGRKRGRNIEDLIKWSPTHKHLHAHLIEMLGSPTEIIKNGKMNRTVDGKTIMDYHIKRSAEQIIRAINCEPWNTVLEIMNGKKFQLEEVK
jgi:hypothetical protein